MDEMNALLAQTLPAEWENLEALYQKKDFQGMKAALHRLHGALCYCNLPELKAIVVEMHFALKKNHALELQQMAVLKKHLEAAMAAYF